MAAENYATQYLSLQDVATALRITRFTVYRIRKTDKTFPRFFNVSQGKKVISKPAFEHWLRWKELESLQP